MLHLFDVVASKEFYGQDQDLSYVIYIALKHKQCYLAIRFETPLAENWDKADHP